MTTTAAPAATAPTPSPSNTVSADGASSRRAVVIIGVIALVGLAIRIAFARLVAPHLFGVGDGLTYHWLGKNLATGLGYVRPPQIPPFPPDRIATAEFPPLLPLIVSLLARLGIEARITQATILCGIGATAVFVIGMLGRRVAGDAVGIVAAAFAAVYPLLFQIDGAFMAESLYVLLIASALWTTYCALDNPKWWRFAMIGACIGLAALTRQEAMLLALLIGLPTLIVVRANRWRNAAALIVTAALVITPWTIRNWVTFHQVIPVSNNAGSVMPGSNCDRTYFGGKDLGSWSFECILVAAALTDSSIGSGTSEAQAYRRWSKVGTDYISDHKGELPRVVAVRLARTWGLWDPRNQVAFDAKEGRDRFWQLVGYVMFFGFVLLAGPGLVALRRQRRAIWPLCSVAVLVTLVTIISYGSTRLRVAAEPALLVAAATGAVSLSRRLRTGQFGFTGAMGPPR